MRRFCTLSCTAASFRSRLPSGAFLSRSTNLRVNRPSELSNRPELLGSSRSIRTPRRRGGPARQRWSRPTAHDSFRPSSLPPSSNAAIQQCPNADPTNSVDPASPRPAHSPSLTVLRPGAARMATHCAGHTRIQRAHSHTRMARRAPAAGSTGRRGWAGGWRTGQLRSCFPAKNFLGAKFEIVHRIRLVDPARLRGAACGGAALHARAEQRTRRRRRRRIDGAAWRRIAKGGRGDVGDGRRAREGGGDGRPTKQRTQGRA